jgi:hypothetical protein
MQCCADTSNSSRLIRHFPAAFSFIKEGIARGGVLVHCFAGVEQIISLRDCFLNVGQRAMVLRSFCVCKQEKTNKFFLNVGF